MARLTKCASIGNMRGSKISWGSWILAAALLVLAIFGGSRISRSRQEMPASKVAIGSDQVYYSRGAAEQNAQALGYALRGTGYFHDAGSSVLLSKRGAITEVTFAVDEGAWDHPTTIAAFEEIGRRVAAVIGGFPIQVELADSQWAVHRSLWVGKVLTGSHDVVYYFGSATEGEAFHIALSLTDAGYFGGPGATVAIWKDGTAAIGFVVGDGVWDRPDAVASFVQLLRKISRPAGWSLIHLRLLDAEMQTRKEVTVE